MKKIDHKIKKDLKLILLLLISTYVAVYLVPHIVRTIILTIIVVLFVRSENNVPWVIFFFFIFSAPAGLFYGQNSWFLFLTSKVGVPYSFLVSFAFLKTWPFVKE